VALAPSARRVSLRGRDPHGRRGRGAVSDLIPDSRLRGSRSTSCRPSAPRCADSRRRAGGRVSLRSRSCDRSAGGAHCLGAACFSLSLGEDVVRRVLGDGRVREQGTVAGLAAVPAAGSSMTAHSPSTRASCRATARVGGGGIFSRGLNPRSRRIVARCGIHLNTSGGSKDVKPPHTPRAARRLV
jgi:hypothetical protein